VIRDALGMVFFFVAFVVLCLRCVYDNTVPKTFGEKFYAWLKWIFLVIAIFISACFTLHFLKGMVSVLLKNILNF